MIKKPETIAQFGSWALVVPMVLFLLLCYIVPILQALWMSVTVPEPGFRNYRELVTNPSTLRILFNTLRICGLTTILAVILGYLLAFALIKARPKLRYLMMLFLFVSFWMPVLVRAFSWLALLHDAGILNSMLLNWGLLTSPLHLARNELGVVIGMTHYMLPYATLTLYANMTGIDWRLMRAAESLGASPVRCFTKVFVPLSLPGIVSAAILVLVMSLGFYITPAILGGGKTVMVAEFVSIQILQTSKWGMGTTMATTLVAAILVLLWIASRFIDLKTLYGSR